jgi:hypothetical protein
VLKSVADGTGTSNVHDMNSAYCRRLVKAMICAVAA